MKLIPIIPTLIVVLFSNTALAEFSSGRSTVVSENSNSYSPSPIESPDLMEKKIHKGNAEISPEGSVGYSSFSGLYLDLNLSYRYFFMDKVALGVISGLKLSENHKQYSLGVSGRWYFLETKNWAYSFTQNIVLDHDRYSYYNETDTGVRGLSQLGAHYFITPGVALGISLGHSYGLSGKRYSSDWKGLSTQVGLNFNF